jgi:autoinducer 2-degrading protein
MYVVCVSVHARAEHREALLAATLDNARATRLEPGNLRFDVLQREDDPDRFFIYEAYRTKEDFPRHQQTSHYLRWRDTVKDWMAEPRLGLRHVPVFFGDGEVA